MATRIYKLRVTDGSLTEAEAETAVSEAAMEGARKSLAEMGVGHRHLRATTTTMANVWS